MSSKKTLCIQDMSSVGRCSLTVISPVLSVMGIQCIPMPTTVLSSHYGGFGNVARQDLTGFCFDSLNEFRRIGVQFDCVLSGFIASVQQVQLVKQAFEYAGNSVKICDPVMADNGRFYSSITPEIAEGIKQLCCDADIITPNITEAAILLEKDYTQTDYTAQQVADIAKLLKDKYDCSVVITGVKTTEGEVNCYVAQKNLPEVKQVKCNYIPVHFPGTGDLFGAVMTANTIQGTDLVTAVEKACRFVELCVKNTYTDDTVDTRFGVDLENNLKYLLG